MSLHEKLLLESNWDEIIDNYIKGYLENKIIIWGSGAGADLVYSFLESKGLKENIKYFVDNKVTSIVEEKNGYEVITPTVLIRKLEKEANYKIIVASMFLSEIKPKLLKMGVKEENIDIRCFGIAKDYYTFKEKYATDIVTENLSSYNEVYNMLNDEFSKKIFVGIINSKLTLDNKYLSGINSKAHMQYFEKNLIHLMSDEVFVDCGSFDGDTLKIFSDVSKGNYKKYIAIEADPDNFKKLKINVSNNNYSNVQIYNLACWDKKEILYFQSNLTAGHVISCGEVEIEADTLDNILSEEKITFIKMDIEGAEENALIGAKKIICEQTPLLAICLYHDLKDFYKIPLLIKSYNENYTFYIRHYTELVDQETVCYAIPKSRLK